MPVDQVFVAFVARDPGVAVSIFINGRLQATATVRDDAGTVVARFPLDFTANQESLDVQVRDAITGDILASDTFATSHIAALFEVQAATLAHTHRDAVQLEQNVSIVGVEDGLLEEKFGVFTGLSRRPDQTVTQYRNQTACLWQAYQFASMEKGLIDALRCLCGDVAIVIRPTRDIVSARIFDLPQFKDSDDDPSTGITLVRSDPESPHFYIADIPSSSDTAYPPGGSPIDVLGPFPSTPGDDYDSDTVEPLRLASDQAHDHEVLVDIGSTEADASALVSEEQVLRQASGPDHLANALILPTVIITASTVSGVPGPTLTEVTHFTVDRVLGEMTWLGSPAPDVGTAYTVEYRFRLDDAIRTVVRKVKPAYRVVVIVFQNVTSGLPEAIVA